MAALPGRAVVDLGAGTGKLARALAARGCDVTGVEPVAEMRAMISAPARAIDGVAEAIPLPDGDADAVTVGQAFHWFDGDRALGEIHRVLRPGGGLALIWNRRDARSALQAQLSALLAAHRGDAPAHGSDAYARAAFERTRLFGPLREERFANEQIVDAGGLEDRIASISFVAGLPDGPRAELLSDVRALAGDGPVTLRYEVELQLTARARSARARSVRRGAHPAALLHACGVGPLRLTPAAFCQQGPAAPHRGPLRNRERARGGGRRRARGLRGVRAPRRRSCAEHSPKTSVVPAGTASLVGRRLPTSATTACASTSPMPRGCGRT